MDRYGRQEPAAHLGKMTLEQMMTNAAHAYTPPEKTGSTALPEQVDRYLDGNDLAAKTQALRISTVDAEGWPHASLLSAGDMLGCHRDEFASSSSLSRRPPPIWCATVESR
jgi:hypothetical protein